MKTILIELTDLEWKTLAHSIEDPETWARDAVSGKLNKCSKRLVAEEQTRLINDPNVETIPATVDGILISHFSQPGYKNRAQRDAVIEANPP